MPDLPIIPGEVQAVTIPQIIRLAGQDLEAGQTVILDASNEWIKAEADSTEERARVVGVTLVTAGSGQPCPVGVAGTMILGPSAGIVVGTWYGVSPNLGRIRPIAEIITSGWWSSVVGVGAPNNAFDLFPRPSGYQVP